MTYFNYFLVCLQLYLFDIKSIDIESICDGVAFIRDACVKNINIKFAYIVTIYIKTFCVKDKNRIFWDSCICDLAYKPSKSCV